MIAFLVIPIQIIDCKVIKLEKRYVIESHAVIQPVNVTSDGNADETIRQLLTLRDNSTNSENTDRHSIFPTFTPRIRSATTTSASDNSDQLTSINSIYYIGPVTIGGETFQVIYDTGSNLLWVPSPSCQAQCAGRAKYTGPSQDLNEAFSLSYGSGTVKGEYVLAAVTLADASLPSFKMGLANSVGFPGFSSSEYDGLLGLAWPGLSRDSDVPSLVPSLYEAKQIDQNLFSMYLTPDGSGGELTLGDVDSSRFQGNMTWISLALEQWWTVELGGVSVANEGVVSSDQSVVNASALTVNSAILDSGTSLIVGPKDSVERVMEAVQSKSGTNVYYDSRSGIYAVDCSSVDLLPSITFTLKDSENVYHYTMPGPAYVIQSLSSNPNICPLSFQEDSGLSGDAAPFWIMGDPFLRTFYSVYDYANSRVGLAAAYPSAGSVIPGSKSASVLVTGSVVVVVFVLAVLF
jgi:hypothetical protein